MPDLTDKNLSALYFGDNYKDLEGQYNFLQARKINFHVHGIFNLP